ncbi:MAG: hypothetical protein H0U79_09095 [Solirubrobacterales bacterium]|nr:hypothetical protein [Solirubrobacterales bacterium]
MHWLVWLGFACEAAALVAISEDRAAWVRRHKLLVFVVVVSSPLVPLALALMQALRGVPALKLVGLTPTAKAAKSAKLLKATRVVARGLALRTLRGRAGVRLPALGWAALTVSIAMFVVVLAWSQGRLRRAPQPSARHTQ